MGPGRREPQKKTEKSPQVVETSSGDVVYLMNSGDGQCQGETMMNSPAPIQV